MIYHEIKQKWVYINITGFLQKLPILDKVEYEIIIGPNYRNFDRNIVERNDDIYRLESGCVYLTINEYQYLKVNFDSLEIENPIYAFSNKKFPL